MRSEKVRKTHAIVTQQCAEVLGFLLVHELDKAGAVDGVDGWKDTTWEQTELKKFSDGLVLRGFWKGRRKGKKEKRVKWENISGTEMHRWH